MALMKFCAHQKSCGCKVLVKLEGRCHKIQKHPLGDDFLNCELFLSKKFEDLRLFFWVYFFSEKISMGFFCKIEGVLNKFLRDFPYKIEGENFLR